MLDVRRLNLLIELAERGTITAVADALHFTPSTVSHALSTLEREVGVPLLERSARRVWLTPAGRALVAEGRNVVADLGAATADARAIGGLERGEVTLATFPSAGATLVAPAVALLRERFLGLDVHVVDAEPDESLQAVRSGSVDVALVYRYGYLPETHDDLALTPLFEDPMLVCVPFNERASGAIRLQDLREATFVAGRAGSACHDFTVAACGRAGFTPRIGYETDDIAFTAALINTGSAVAIMARLLLATAPAPVATHTTMPALPPRQIFAAHRPSAAHLVSTIEVLAALKASVAATAGTCV